MIQIHTVESIETAIMLGVLIPPDAPPKSRHRFWIGEYRVDAYLNAKGYRYIHWLHRPTGAWKHPRPDGAYQLFDRGNGWYAFYEDISRGSEFRPSAAPPGPGEGAVGEDV